MPSGRVPSRAATGYDRFQSSGALVDGDADPLGARGLWWPGCASRVSREDVYSRHRHIGTGRADNVAGVQYQNVGVMLFGTLIIEQRLRPVLL